MRSTCSRSNSHSTQDLLFASEDMPDTHRRRYGGGNDGAPAFPTPRFTESVAIPPRQNVQAAEDGMNGMLPPKPARMMMRGNLDKHYSVRQTFPIRKPQPPSEPVKLKAIDRRSADGDGEPEGETLDIDYRDYGVEPVIPEDKTRRGVRKIIRSKLHWGRFEQVGSNRFLQRSKPNKVAVAESRNTTSAKDYNKQLKDEINGHMYPIRKYERRAQNATREKEKTLEAEARRAVMDHERLQKIEVLAEKFDDELRLQREKERERKRRQQMWAAIQAHVAVSRAFEVMLKFIQHKNAKVMQNTKSTVKIQQFVRAKKMAQKLRETTQNYRALLSRIRPHAYFFVIRWRARRKQRMSDRIQVFLHECLKTNQVKRRISSYIYNVRRLQNVWRHCLRRQKARMLMLSRQWDRTFALIVSKGKHGRLHDQNEVIVSKRRGGDHITSMQSSISRSYSNTPRRTGSQAPAPNNTNAIKIHGGQADAVEHPAHKLVSFKKKASLKVDINAAIQSFAPSTSALNQMSSKSTSARTPNASGPHGHHNYGSSHHHFLPSVWEERMIAHNSLHINLDAKQLSMLRRIVHYPVIKWQVKREFQFAIICILLTLFHGSGCARFSSSDVVRTLRLLSSTKKKLKHMLSSANRNARLSKSLSPLPRTKMQVSPCRTATLYELKVTDFGSVPLGHEMANKLLGEMAGAEEPKAPHLRCVISPLEMQTYIGNALERLTHTSGQLREEAAAAELFLKESEGHMGSQDSTNPSALTSSPHHYKPWWICHETCWHAFHADPHDSKQQKEIPIL